MERFFIDPMKQGLSPKFKIQTFNLGQGNKRPAIKIEWSNQDNKVVTKKTILLEDGELLSEYVEDMVKKHITAYRELVKFSNNFIKTPYKSVHNIISRTYGKQIQVS